MRLRMLWYRFRMLTIRDKVKRTTYLKKRSAYASIGENMTIQLHKISLYPELIGVRNNIRMTFNVLSMTYDVVHNMLNRISPETEKILVGGVFYEKVDYTEIRNNIFIGTRSIILCDTKIGSNVVVAADSIVTRDVPGSMTVAGALAKIIDIFDAFSSEKIQETYLRYVNVPLAYYYMVDANTEWEKLYLRRGNSDD